MIELREFDRLHKLVKFIETESWELPSSNEGVRVIEVDVLINKLKELYK